MDNKDLRWILGACRLRGVFFSSTDFGWRLGAWQFWTRGFGKRQFRAQEFWKMLEIWPGNFLGIEFLAAKIYVGQFGGLPILEQ